MSVAHTPLRQPARSGFRGRLMLVLGLTVALAGLLPSPAQAGWLTDTWPGYSASPGSEAAQVLDLARRQVGKPYKYAAVGPDAFDCSGLVWYLFKTTGLADRMGGKRRGATGYLNWFKAYGEISTNLADARAGDILIWGGGQHAGIYVSGNWAVSALNGRYDVRIHRVDPMGVPFTAVLLVHMSRGDGSPPSSTPSPSPTPTDDAGASPLPTPTAAPTSPPDSVDSPLPPAEVHAVAQPGLQVALDWSTGTAAATPLRYRIYRSGYFIGSTTSLSMLNSLWLPGRYKYQIQTVSADGIRSAKSAGARVDAFVDGAPTDVNDTTPPTTPTGLTTQSLGDRRVALSWQPSTDSGPTAVAYLVMRGTKVLARVSVPYYVDQPATTGTFPYRVFAFDGYGNLASPVRIYGAAIP